MTAGLVSIVVTSYNHAEYLTKRMESLFAQTYHAIEILVIDDCSSDNSLEILKDFKSDPRVTLIAREVNAGWVVVSNQGAELASGEYLLYANCDDACEPEMVAELVKALQENPSAGLAFCRSLMVDASGTVKGNDYAAREPAFKARFATNTLISGQEMSRFLLHSCVMPNLSAVLMRKSHFLAAGGFSSEYKANSDWALFFRLAERCDVAYVTASLNHFRQHQTTIRSQTKSRITYEEFFRLLLGEIRRLDLNFLERCKYRSRVMELWGHHMLKQPLHSLRNFPYHFWRVLVLDPFAIIFFPMAMANHTLCKSLIMFESVTHLIKKIKKVVADYSLRKFLFYAIWPSNWHLLIKLRFQKKHEIAVFHKRLSSVIKSSPSGKILAREVFRPWLVCDPVTCLTKTYSAPISLPTDSEMQLRIDRLSWALELAADNLPFAWGGVEEWLKSREKTLDVCTDAYSCSERIANLVMLCSLSNPPVDLGKSVRHLVNHDAEVLLGQIEYHGELNTNNHILNNARALLLAGLFLGEGRFYDAGLFIFEHQLFRHISPDGLLREGSSHYQLVITRWLLEIACVFRLQDPSLFEHYRPVFEKSLTICQHMFKLADHQGHLALIGDISPDFPPDFYRSLPALGQNLFEKENVLIARKCSNSSIWDKFFGTFAPAPSGKWQADNASWAGLSHDGWHLLLHADTSVTDTRVTHGHHDLFSFDLSYEGLPLIVDPGRRNYTLHRDTQGAGILEEWHNTFMVDNKRTGFCPRGYMPLSWWKSFRSCPTVIFKGDALHLELHDKLPRGVKQMKRCFAIEPEGSMHITSTLILSDKQVHSVRMVLHLAGKIEVGPHAAIITHDNAHFLLAWDNLSEPVVQIVERYVAYEKFEPCHRLEWLLPVYGPKWQTTFSVSRDKINL